MMTISYEINDSLYLNITNACPNACVFCVRTKSDTVSGSDPLWLDHEPSLDEIFADLKRRDLAAYKEIVFCGFGEPFSRLDDALAVCRWIRARCKTPIRVNTCGLANLMYDRDTTPELAGLVDTLSISLNAATPEAYDALCHSRFGSAAHPALLEYAKLAKIHVPHVILSVVDDTMSPADIEACRALAQEAGVDFRVRNYIP